MSRRRRKQDRATRVFWKLFEQRFGKPSERPESYWSAWLGDVCSLRPADIGDLTPAQLMGCANLAEQKGYRLG